MVGDTPSNPLLETPYNARLWDRSPRFSFSFASSHINTNTKARLVDKRGRIKVLKRARQNRSVLYLSDLFTTLTNFHWWKLQLVFWSSYVMTWTIFAILVMVSVLIMGNQEHCLPLMESFTDYMLFSIQTQATIGYGNYSFQSDPKCWLTVGVIVCQNFVGITLDAVMLGLLFTKMTQSTKRASTILFSKRAVIAQVDGRTVLMFRLADLHTQHIVAGHITLLAYYRDPLIDGDVDPQAHHLSITPTHKIPLLVPQTVMHVMDDSSPLAGLSIEDMQDMDMELIALYEGQSATMGLTIQARQSYLPQEILWGYTFQEVVKLSQNDTAEGSSTQIDFEKFDAVTPQAPGDRPTIAPESSSSRVVL